MAPWFAVEALFGDKSLLPWEAGFLASFLAVLVLNAAHASRAARIVLIATANGCVLAGALPFDASAGGTLPFLTLAALPLLLFGPQERRMLILGAALPLLLFAICETGAAVRLLAIHPRPPPRWYFAANAASAFAIAFVIPFFFYRANLKAEASLERLGQAKLRRVIDSNLIGVVRGRLSGRIEEANDTFLTLLGYTRQDLAAGVLDLGTLAPDDSFDPGHPRALADLPKRGRSSVYERVLVRKDGTTVPALVGVTLLDDARDDGGQDEVAGFVLDLTAQKRVDAQKAMLRETEEALRLRDLFNSIASHELKTPLTALMLSLQVLRRCLDREASPSSTLRAQVKRCESSAGRMGELIHTLLDVAQIHDGRLNLAVREMDVGEAVGRIAGGFEANGTGCSPQIDVQTEGPVIARLDSLRFDQLLTNLLSNAIKYGAGKPIEVRVGRDPTADVARLEVIDHGPGIEPEMAEKIFEPFQRAASIAQTIPGLGLGLYVVKMIVDGHGGRVHVESQPGEGARFVVELPCAAAAESSTSRPAPGKSSDMAAR